MSYSIFDDTGQLSCNEKISKLIEAFPGVENNTKLMHRSKYTYTYIPKHYVYYIINDKLV